MTTTLAPDARRNVALFSAPGDQAVKPKFRFEKKSPTEGSPEVDVLIVEDLPVFRSGTFRDSMGYQHTWEDIHMDQMVAHFDLLKNRQILPDVPVRAGHPSFLTNALHEVIGYHSSLRSERRTNPVDGKEYLYLLGTFEVSDPGAIDKISRGLWRNVSSEVGSWLSNDEAEFWPVYQGVAYVDFSAVEGLRQFNSHNGVGQRFSLMLDDEKEAPVAGEDEKQTGGSTQGGPANQGNGQTGTANHGQQTPPPFQFSIGGRTTTDFAAVQSYINTLETAAHETKQNGRKNFIKSLAEGAAPKILATQIEGIEGYALNLDEAGWEAFQKSWEVAAPNAALAQHSGSNGSGQTGTPAPPDGTPEARALTEVDTLEGIVKQHRMGKMPEPALQATASYKKLKQLKPDSPVLAG